MVQKIIQDSRDILSCDEIAIITDFETGEKICQSCGKVLQQNISDPRKARSFSGEENRSHVGDGTSIALYDLGLSTIIGRINKDFVGRNLSNEMKQTMYRMRIWDARSQIKSSSEKNLRYALFEMYKLKEKLGLSDAVIERAAYVYRKAVKAQLIRGRSIKSMIGACLYVACRDMDVTRTMREISNQLQEKPKLIAKSYRMLFQNLKLTVPVPDTINTIIKIANNLHVSETTKREAIRIFDILKEKELTAGKNPNAVAATVIYMAGIKTGTNLTQMEVTKISGITSVTIRNRLQDFRKYVELV
ncbi:MAG: transcription initiation factor IIB [Nitrosarchaeum sp.]|nr:transcription initiation factor IIB [Nitrosarchaeum sp.]